MKPAIRIKWLGEVDYATSYQAMLAFNAARSRDTQDELWVLTHPPVFTQGVSCDDQPRINPWQVPIVKSDRGGKMTYHGPGQIIIYCLLDLKRRGLGPKSLVRIIEQAIIDVLERYQLGGERKAGAPGVYIEGTKIAALGLRIRKGVCYHGLSFNVDMDLTPYTWIDPCGTPDLEVTSLAELGVEATVDAVAELLCRRLKEALP